MQFSVVLAEYLCPELNDKWLYPSRYSVVAMSSIQKSELLIQCLCKYLAACFVTRLQHFFVFLLFQRHNGEVSSGASVKHLGRNRFSVSFQLEDIQKPEQDLYRCVTQSSRDSGVSNFAELIVKGEELVCFPSFVLSVFVLLPIMCTSEDNGILAKSMSLYSFFIIACILTSYTLLS